MSRIPIGLGMTMDIYDAPMMKSLSGLMEKTGQDAGALLKKRAPLLAKYLAEATMPIAGLTKNPGESNPDGISKAAHFLGMNAVTRDLGRVYKSPSVIHRSIKESNGEHGLAMAKGFTAFLKKGDLQQAKAILDRSGIAARQLEIIQWDGGTEHKKSRKQRGRVSENKKPKIVTDAAALKKYSDMRRKNVGFAKGGWINAGRTLGKVNSEIPVWMKWHASPGAGKDFTDDVNHPRFELQNGVSYMTKIMPETYLVQATVAFERSLKQELVKIMNYIATKESR